MKKTTALLIAMMALALAPAHGQNSPESKACFKRCMDTLTVKNVPPSDYDAEAVEKDPTKTDAEKKKSHKKAVAGVCSYYCADE